MDQLDQQDHKATEDLLENQVKMEWMERQDQQDTLEWMEKYGIITDLMVNRKNAKLSIREPEWKRPRMGIRESLNDIEF